MSTFRFEPWLQASCHRLWQCAGVGIDAWIFEPQYLYSVIRQENLCCIRVNTNSPNLWVCLIYQTRHFYFTYNFQQINFFTEAVFREVTWFASYWSRSIYASKPQAVAGHCDANVATINQEQSQGTKPRWKSRNNNDNKELSCGNTVSALLDWLVNGVHFPQGDTTPPRASAESGEHAYEESRFPDRYQT